MKKTNVKDAVIKLINYLLKIIGVDESLAKTLCKHNKLTYDVVN